MWQKYNPELIEKKWQKYWEKNETFEVKEDKKKEKFYALIEFPYPSGEGLHVGHTRPFTAMDVISRKKKMEGYNVLYPIGFDAFGLPTENYAIKSGRPPAQVTKKNIANFTRQLKMLGYSFAWSRCVNTTDPKYYKWTQWIFLQLFKRGLAYKKNMPINWCLDCKIGLANEEVVEGKCERCGGLVEKRDKEQWMLAITKYADKLLDGLKEVDYIERAKVQQENWIGKSSGASVNFKVVIDGVNKNVRNTKVRNGNSTLMVFTTRPDTLFGCTYMVVAPEHNIIKSLKLKIKNYNEVRKYIELAKKKTDLERTELQKEKTGVELKGIKAVNPVNGEAIPIWSADYVLVSYGTGAIMAVPAHDERDWEFAKKFGLEIREVIAGGDVKQAAHVADGTLVNSDFLNGLNVEEAKKKIISWLEEKDFGRKEINYKLRDWVFSRQRYWGEPIPLVDCEKCGWVPLPESQLPLELPKVKKYQPTDTGESPLSAIEKWLNTKCPQCGGPAKRETDTMPNWAGSSWYFLRYMDPNNEKALASQEKMKYWGPIDWYNGGMEHTVLHLLYSRFWNQFLYDIGAVPFKEPYKKRTSHGMILGPDGEKMSKSRGNVISPDEMVEKFGSDAFRTYIMFMGPFDQAVALDTNGLVGVRRFLDRVWSLREKLISDSETKKIPLGEAEPLLHQTIKKVTEDIEKMHFNTAVAKMMELVNELSKHNYVSYAEYFVLLKLLSPFAPHICEELWSGLGNKKSLAYESWPQYDVSKIVEETITLAVQVNGKLRETLEVPADITEKQAKEQALASAKIQKWLAGQEPKRIIYVKGKLVSIVV